MDKNCGAKWGSSKLHCTWDICIKLNFGLQIMYVWYASPPSMVHGILIAPPLLAPKRDMYVNYGLITFLFRSMELNVASMPIMSRTFPLDVMTEADFVVPHYSLLLCDWGGGLVGIHGPAFRENRVSKADGRLFCPHCRTLSPSSSKFLV